MPDKTKKGDDEIDEDAAVVTDADDTVDEDEESEWTDGAVKDPDEDF